MPSEDAKIAWEGDSLERVKSFPKAVRQELGLDIRRLQQGKRPHDSRIGEVLYMLHGFTKKSAKTSRKDLSIARRRLKAVRVRILEERNNARKTS